MLLIELFLTFFKIGILGFGGGMAILPLIYQSVQEFSTMSPEAFADLFAISQATPGPMAINAATFVGYQVAGTGGAVAATMGVACPSFILVAITAGFLKKHREDTIVKGVFQGIRPAMAGMIGSGVILIGQLALFSGDLAASRGVLEFLATIEVIPTLMTAITLLLVWKFKVSPIKIIIVMGVLGAVLCR